VILLCGFTSDKALGPYLRGQLRLHQVDLNTPLRQWLDVVYALWCDAPHEVLGKARQVIDKHAVTIAPDRDTWGLLPEHIAQMGDLVQLDE